MALKELEPTPYLTHALLVLLFEPDGHGDLAKMDPSHSTLGISCRYLQAFLEPEIGASRTVDRHVYYDQMQWIRCLTSLATLFFFFIMAVLYQKAGPGLLPQGDGHRLSSLSTERTGIASSLFKHKHPNRGNRWAVGGLPRCGLNMG